MQEVGELHVGWLHQKIELGQRPAELRHALAAFGVRLCHSEHRMLVGVEGHWTTMSLEIAFQSLEVRRRSLKQRTATASAGPSRRQ